MLLPGEETSASLLERAKGDSPDAWQAIVRIYGPLVYGWARRAGLQPSDASDIVQDVFAAVSIGLKAFRRDRRGDSFRGWLWTVTRNKIHDHFRKVRSAPQASGGSSANIQLMGLPERPDPLEDLASARQAGMNALNEYRQAFENQVWQAFWRVVVDECAPADVAAELGLTVWAVYKAKSRVLQRLRQELDGLLTLDIA